MRSFLQQPYPFSENVGRKLTVCGGIGLFIFFFLIIFEPFGFDELAADQKWLHALLFGAVTFLISSSFQIVIPKIFPTVFREQDWRSWKEIVYLLITTLFIGAGNYGLMLYLYPERTSFSNLLRVELITLQVGIFPILFVVFMKQLLLYRRYAAEAREATEDLQVNDEEAASPLPAVSMPVIRLLGDNQKEELSLLAHDLLYISSSDNYVNVHFREKGQLRSLLIRGSLKKMEEQLAGHPAFFRCHRMYLVNLGLVNGVSGNAQGLKLHMEGPAEAIPVSRNLTETVKERLHHLSHSPQKA